MSQKESQDSITSKASNEVDEDVGELNLPLPQNHAPLPRFANVCLFFEKLSSIRGDGSIERRHEVIAKFISIWRTHVGDELYPFVRLWFPEEDEQLKQLKRIKDTMVAKILVQALDLPEQSPDAISLMDVRKGAYGMKRNTEDGLSAKAQAAIVQRFTQREHGTLNVAEVAEKLVKLLEAKKDERVRILKDLLYATNAKEMSWILKIILGNLSLNCSVRTFLTELHPDALKVYLVNKNLKMVCDQLWSQEFQVTERDKCVHLLSHFFPMRAKFVKGAAEHMKAVVDLMSGDSASTNSDNKQHSPKAAKTKPEFLIEEKVDGERIQLHWIDEDDTVTIFSRNGKDHTLAYQGIFKGESIENSKDEAQTKEDADAPTKKASFSMKDIVADNVHSCIIDGEVVAWDPETNDICGQSKVRELTSHNRGGRYRHMLLVFDIVLVNGEVLTEEPLFKRKEQLEKVFPQAKRSAGKGRIQILPYKIGHDVNDVATEFNRVLSYMSEGLVVKNLQSTYEIDGRTDSWIKVKPEFVDGYQGENLDLIIVGCYWGTGKHKNHFGSYLCALRDETKPKRYVALCRVGSGICIAMYDYINEKIDQYRFSQKEPPSWVELGTERAPDFYIEPNNSIVFEIKYSMISAATAEKSRKRLGYGVGYSLRFPRYVSLREDKDVNSVLTIGEFLDLYFSSSTADASKLGKRRQTGGGASMSTRNGSPKKMRIREATPAEPIEASTNIFAGHSFYVCGDIVDPEVLSKSELEKLIMENGGQITSLVNAGVIPIADRNVPNAAKFALQNIPVMHPRYLFDCINNERMLEAEPSHFLGPVPGYALNTQRVDNFGFSLYRKQSREDIKSLFDQIDTSGLRYSSAEHSSSLQALLHAGDSTAHLDLRAFLFTDMEVFIGGSAEISLARSMLLYGGARFVDTQDKASHVLDKSAEGSNNETTKSITSEWVLECWRARKILPHDI